MTVADVVAKYNELSKSYIDPYVVRNHAFTFDQLEKTDYYDYIDDAPRGYREHINFSDPSREIHSHHHHKSAKKPALKKHHKAASPKKHHIKASPKKALGPTKKI